VPKAEAALQGDELIGLFNSLYADIREEDRFDRAKPLLAHYTSLDALEKILSSDEIWFSNPLYMNDLDEVRFGFFHGARHFKESSVIGEALRTANRQERFRTSLDHYIGYFENEHLLDTYIFCLSQHMPGDKDGLLSMWRGYGRNGNGAAIIFDASKANFTPASPLIVGKVDYGSQEQRFAWFDRTASAFAKVIATNEISDDNIHLTAYALFLRLKVFSLFTKHHGFEEEQEWRVVYLVERDTDKKLKPMQHYINGARGIEPKLRFKVAPIEGVTAPDLSLQKLISMILLGPSTSNPLAWRSVGRMLELIGKPELKDRLISSSIPFRPI
jgi:hypothetical protein